MIDAHLHLWELGRNGCTWPTADLPAIHRDHGVDDAVAIARAAGVASMVLVQSQEDAADTRWLFVQAAADPAVAGVVGWMDLTCEDAAARLAALAADPALKGIRLMAQDRAADWLDDPRLDAGLSAMAEHDLALDLLVRPQHLPASLRLADRHPRLHIAIDHLAKPPIAMRWSETWAADMAVLAERPTLAAKLSGLVTEMAPGQPIETLVPYLDAALHWFGPERVMWGSDWPVINLAGAYAEWLAFARAHVPAAHHAAVFGQTAATFYRLDVGS